MVARAVEPLAVQRGERADRAQPRAIENARRVIGVRSHALDLEVRESPRLRPHGGRDAHAPHVVQPARAAHQRQVARRQPTRVRGTGGERCDRGRVAEHARRLHVHEIGDRLARGVERRVVEPRRCPRLRVDGGAPRRARNDLRQQRATDARERVRCGGVVRATAARAHDVERGIDTA